MSLEDEIREREMELRCTEDRFCSKCGAWYASDPNQAVCDGCDVCPEGECEARHPDYCDHDWQEVGFGPENPFYPRRSGASG